MTRMPVTEIDQPVVNELTERRYVYAGDTVNQSSDFMPRVNRPVKRRKRSPFNIIFALFTVSILIVFYIWNKISVNRLVVEVNDLQDQHKKILYSVENVRAQINQKSNLERVGKIATTQLGLTNPKEQPQWFEVPEDKLSEAQQR